MKTNFANQWRFKKNQTRTPRSVKNRREMKVYKTQNYIGWSVSTIETTFNS